MTNTACNGAYLSLNGIFWNWLFYSVFEGNIIVFLDFFHVSICSQQLWNRISLFLAFFGLHSRSPLGKKKYFSGLINIYFFKSSKTIVSNKKIYHYILLFSRVSSSRVSFQQKVHSCFKTELNQLYRLVSRVFFFPCQPHLFKRCNFSNSWKICFFLLHFV